MGDDILEFEVAKKSFVAERETFNSKKKGLLWRVTDAEEKLSQEKQLNADRQRDWTAACERSNRELKSARDEVVKIADRLVNSDEFAKYMFNLGGAAYNNGRKDGYAEGKAAALAKEKDHQFELFKVDCAGNYMAKRQEYEFLEFGILKAIEKLSRRGIAVMRMNDGYDRLLCFIDPTVHLVVKILGGLQRFYCYYANASFTCA
ncbi:hypothetical protein Hanom_Chr12g01162481 [Helianthus anomalus]